MWNGRKRNYGVLEASTVYKSFTSQSSSEDALQFKNGMDRTKPYMFHYEQWTDSCALRFGIQALGIAFLVAMY